MVRPHNLLRPYYEPLLRFMIIAERSKEYESLNLIQKRVWLNCDCIVIHKSIKHTVNVPGWLQSLTIKAIIFLFAFKYSQAYACAHRPAMDVHLVYWNCYMKSVYVSNYIQYSMFVCTPT